MNTTVIYNLPKTLNSAVEKVFKKKNIFKKLKMYEFSGNFGVEIVSSLKDVDLVIKTRVQKLKIPKPNLKNECK